MSKKRSFFEQEGLVDKKQPTSKAPRKSHYLYRVQERTSDDSECYRFVSLARSVHGVVHEAARDFHQRHDGWEAHWPLTIRLLSESGALLGEFEVDRELVPVFRVRGKDAAGDHPVAEAC